MSSRRPTRRSRAVAAAAILGAVIATACLTTTPARADGDPASDFLYTQSVFLPTSASAAQRADLARLAALSKRHGVPIRIAVIGSPYDLGSITPLWRKPQQYARFLGVELSYVYHDRLLIVMPNGFGVYHGKRPVGREQSALGGIAIRPGVDGLVRAASAAVRAIAAADGHPLPALSPAPAPPRAPHARSGGLGIGAVLALVVGLLAIAAAWGYSLRARPVQRGPLARLAGRRLPRLRVRVPAPPPRRVALLVLVPALLLAGGATAWLHTGAGGTAPPGAATPVIWAAGSRAAPEFTLRDERGRPISLRSLRGRPVILAFIDPVCRNLCPQEASIIGQVERRLPAARRPAVVAVSVNPWGNARRRLLQDIRNWRVGSQWRWAVGARADLARVWRAYAIGVRVKRIEVGGQTVHEISHTEAVYLIDRNGGQRQLITYPFTADDLMRGLERIEPA
jgi:cytochrome oxidase Cu insertion factor (SCO1/SenC/PrrC family)